MTRLFLALITAFSPSATAASTSGYRMADSLQVGIAHQAPEVTLRLQGQFSVVDQTTGETKSLRRNASYRIEADRGKRLVLGPFLFLGATRLLPQGPEDYAMIEGRKYSGHLIFKPNADGTVTVVDELGIEEYLYGVLPEEMSEDWPLEALKAQAVVARTYAMNNLGKFSDSGFDLSNDTRSQVYTGSKGVAPRVKRAVDETRGEVLEWRRQLMQAFFHSCCGGQTADPAVVWGMRGSPKPLRGVSDRFCKASPYYQWSAYFTKDDILRALQSHGHDALRLKSVRAGTRTSAGHLLNLRFDLDTGSVRVRANDFRTWMGVSDLKSTQIWRVVAKSKGYQFVGRGFGHGVGLCQWGARGQALAGKDYRKILQFYFPGSALARHEIDD